MYKIFCNGKHEQRVIKFFTTFVKILNYERNCHFRYFNKE